jgi:hypothetical protein
MTNAQFALFVSIPIHNNTRLGRLEVASDVGMRRMDELQRSMSDLQRRLHNDMLSFPSAILGEIANIRERVAVVEARRRRWLRRGAADV